MYFTYVFDFKWPLTFQVNTEDLQKMFGTEICSHIDILPFLGIYRLEFTNTDRLPYYVIEQDFVQDLGADEIIFDWNIDKVKPTKL